MGFILAYVLHISKELKQKGTLLNEEDIEYPLRIINIGEYYSLTIYATC